ncbi:peptidase inhibitor family I36 protein [Streptosporangium longisporum]|uniref:Uncharacterized protein n=1 Tax=Streptosporangium longisporum TaxID=46187 RepID=A0ABP6K6L5_9ACTN
MFAVKPVLGALLLVGGIPAGALGPVTTAPTGNSETRIIATYKGKKIDLGKGWQGAQACAEFAVGDVRCYDTATEADLATQPASEVGTLGRPDCPSRWVCLWQDENFTGRRL